MHVRHGVQQGAIKEYELITLQQENSNIRNISKDLSQHNFTSYKHFFMNSGASK